MELEFSEYGIGPTSLINETKVVFFIECYLFILEKQGFVGG